MPKHFLLALAGAILHCGLASAQTLVPVPLHMDIPVSDVGADNSLAESNTSRKLAVGADGAIYALFRSPTNGIRVARSGNRGASFAPSVQVSASDFEAEIAIASDGDLHVVWSTGTDVYHAISHDGAQTFSTPVPVVVGSSVASVHMAVDGDRVYLIARNGDVIFRSDDDGGTFGTVLTGTFAVFSDIFVDPLTHEVLVVTDDPNVYYYSSTDFGQTFGPPIPTAQVVYYSVGALSVTEGGRYLFFAGELGNLERIAVDTQTYTGTPVNATANSVTRSLSSDVFGNVVSGFLEIGTNDLKFEHSNDLAVTFGAATTVVQAATRANAAINNINGDILFLYEKGNQVYLSTYERALVGYDVNVAPSALSFGTVEVNMQATLDVTLTNVGASGVAVTSVDVTGEFSITDDCGGTVPANGDCTMAVTFEPTTVGPVSGVLSMTLGGINRQVSLNGTGGPVQEFIVTPTAGANGAIDPAGPQSVTRGDTATFTLAPADDYRIDTVTGCGGALTGTTYTTGPTDADCTVTATFEPADEEVVVVGKSNGGGGATEWWLVLLGVIALFGRRLLPVFASLLLVGTAQAAEQGPWYVGGAISSVQGGQSAADVAADLERRGFTADSVDVGDLDRTGYRLFAGYRFTPNWAVEGGFTDLGDVSVDSSATVPVGEAEAYARALLESLPASASGFEASVIYRYPLSNGFALAARAGAWYWENDLRAVFGDEHVNASPSGTDILFGVGFEWSPASQWAIGLELSRYRVDSENLDVLGANAKFNW